MASKPTQRSLKHLRSQGWLVANVEKYLNFPGMKFPRRIDVFGFADLLACRPPIGNIPGRIALVQTTDHTSHSKHRDKLVAIPELKTWKEAGGLVFLQSWGKRPKDGVRGAKKVWTLREEEL